MKKLIAILLALVLCLSLVACGGGEQNKETQENTESNDSTNQTEGEALILQNTDFGTIINIYRFNELLETVELTTENWTDYIEVCAYSKEVVEKDAFGEVVSTETHTWYQLGAKENKYHHFREFVIELKNKETGELELYRGDTGNEPNVKDGFSLDNYECTRIKGTLYLIDVPEEVIFQTEGGSPFFNVGYEDVSMGPAHTCYISGRLVGGMFDFLTYN